jgi:hypothetical protein
MIKRINQYLLTHYPLLWNSRILWVLSINIFIHLAFLISGFVVADKDRFISYYSYMDVGAPGLYIFSVLCSLLLLIIWLIYFLRNNAFKNFYRIDKWHMAREFLLILLILFSSVTYFESFNYGIRLKVRSITSLATFEREVNTINHALAYIPTDEDLYFILNSCEELKKRDTSDLIASRIEDGRSSDQNVRIYSITDIRNYSTDSVLKSALNRPDSFSYKNYCKNYLSYDDYPEVHNFSSQINPVKNRWIERHQTDSIRQLLQTFTGICHKYSVPHRLNTDSLTAAIFATPYNSILQIIPASQFRDSAGITLENKYFIEPYELERVYSFINGCLPNKEAASDLRNRLTVEGYVALSLAIFVLCYRRLSRKVFLISLIGSIVWAIIIGLIIASTQASEGTFASICLFLGLAFLLTSILNRRSQKTISGALLSWHAFLAPFLILFVMMIINNYYDHLPYQAGYNFEEMHPFSAWIHSHTWEIALVNLLLSSGYVLSYINYQAKLWHTTGT